MEQWNGRVGARWLLLALPLTAGLGQACGGSNDKQATPAPEAGIFGGSGGVTQADPAKPNPSASAGASGSGGTSSADACQNTPPGRLALIDDFDDGDSIAAFEPGRDAYWFTISDGTAGTIEPKDEFLPVPGGYLDTRSAHVTVSDFSDWGASLMANISQKEDVRCPYNASAFAGLRFVARGKGRVRVLLQVPSVISTEYGGTCNEQAGQVCYDSHGVFIELGPTFQTYELPWSSFQQRGFGAQLPFDPKTILGLQFLMERADLPVDLWVDQVEFWDGKPALDGSDGAGGAGGAGGATGQAGEPNTEAGPASAGVGGHG